MQCTEDQYKLFPAPRRATTSEVSWRMAQDPKFRLRAALPSRSSAIVLRSNLNNNRVGVFLQSGAFANILESKISHNRESGVVVRGIGSVVFIHCCNVQYNQVHGCVAEEGARVRACKCDFNNNAVSSLSSTDPTPTAN